MPRGLSLPNFLRGQDASTSDVTSEKDRADDKGEGCSQTGEKRQHHASDSKSFVNPWPSGRPPALSDFKEKGFPLQLGKAGIAKHPRARELRVVKPQFDGSLDPNAIKAVWLGHASCYVELPFSADDDTSSKEASAGLRFLFDPVFSARAGPTQYTGPKRLLDPPCTVSDLPRINAVFISHNHYDHLDYQSIIDVHKHSPAAVFFVPLGNATWFEQSGIPDHLVRELDWDEDHWLDTGVSESTAASKRQRVRITCVAAQHNSGRPLSLLASMRAKVHPATIYEGRRHNDLNESLWCGWVVEQFKAQEGPAEAEVASDRQCAMYFAGDTGYKRYRHSKEVCPIFKSLGERFGSFDLSFVPIWRGGTLGFISWSGLRIDHNSMYIATHGTPEDGVAIHKAVKSQVTIPIHFGTFIGSTSETFEALVELYEACESAGDVTDDFDGDYKSTGKTRMAAIDIGRIIEIECSPRKL